MVQVQGPVNQEHWWARSEVQCFSLSRKWIHLYSMFLFYLDFQQFGWCSSPWWGESSTQSTIKLLISFRTSFIDTPRNNVFQLSVHSLSQVCWHIKLNITDHKSNHIYIYLYVYIYIYMHILTNYVLRYITGVSINLFSSIFQIFKVGSKVAY